MEQNLADSGDGESRRSHWTRYLVHSNSLSNLLFMMAAVAGSSSSTNADVANTGTLDRNLCSRPACLGIPYHEYGVCALTTATTYEELLDEILADESIVSTLNCEQNSESLATAKPQQRFAPVVSDTRLVNRLYQNVQERILLTVSESGRGGSKVGWCPGTTSDVDGHTNSSVLAYSLHSWSKKTEWIGIYPQHSPPLGVGIMRFLPQNGRPEIKDYSFADF